MYRLRLTALALCVATLGGCAHQTVAPEALPEPIPGDAPPAADDAAPPLQASVAPQTPRLKPEQDPRYGLPPAKERSLSIFLGSQTFEYVEDGQIFASGQISSGTADHPTPKGSFRVLSKDENKRSGKYTNYFNDNTPMPYSLQFYGPYFVHEGWVPGYADSHGCVRLHYEDARLVYNRMRIGDAVLVKQEGVARAANPWPDMVPVF